MPRGSKSIDAVSGHRTKAEREARQQAEQDMLSGKKGFERANVKADPVAHAEFKRVSALMKAVGKDDALYFAIINRYCELFSEIIRYQSEMARWQKLMEELQERFDETEANAEEIIEFAKTYKGMGERIDKINAIIQQKRKMMLDLEKENGMTVAAALRAIPKGTGKKETDPLMAILGGN